MPGGAGGLILFLYSFKKGHYRNNKYLEKVCIEIFRAMITATFITMLLNQDIYQVAAAFVIGITWSGIIQVIRTKISKIVEAALGEKLSGGRK